ASLQREIRARWTEALEVTVHDDLVGFKPLPLKVANDRMHVLQIQAWLLDEELNDRSPEQIMLEAAAEPRGDDYFGRVRGPASPAHLRPAKGVVHRQIDRGETELGGHRAGQRDRDIGRADVLPGTEMHEPGLLAQGLDRGSRQERMDHEPRHEIARQ